MEKISQYCQKCRAANQPGDVVCYRCGTRLMLVVIPPSVRHEEAVVPSYYEDHLLERVSLLELRLGQIAERLSMALDLMLRQAKTTQVDHFLLETLIESLGEAGMPANDALKQKLRERLHGEDAKASSEDAKSTPEKRREDIFKNILLNHKQQPNAELFAHLVEEGMKFLNEGEEKQGFRMLERAAQASPQNAELLIFLGGRLFRADKFEAAKKYLEQAAEIEPARLKILLLLGVLYADEGDAENARQLLSVVSNQPEMTFCANYAWGFLAAAEENWLEALGGFLDTLEARDLPEIQYLTACAYFQLERFQTAREYLEKAVARDENFSDAWFMLGVIYKLAGEEAKESEAFQRAWQTKEAGAECVAFFKQKKDVQPSIALPFQRLKTTERHLLTSGARRLTKLFREEIYKIIG